MRPNPAGWCSGFSGWRHPRPYLGAWAFLPAAWLCGILLWHAEETAELYRRYRWGPDCRPCADRYPVGATGVCWCAVEGQQGTLLLRPLRSHLGNSWAEGRDLPGLPGLGKQTLLQCRPVQTSPTRLHACTCEAANKASSLKSRHLRDRGCQQKRGLVVFQSEALPGSRARPRGGVICPWWVHHESSSAGCRH